MPHNQCSPAFGYAHNIYFYTKPSEANWLAYTVVIVSITTTHQPCFFFKKKKREHEEEIKFSAQKEERVEEVVKVRAK